MFLEFVGKSEKEVTECQTIALVRVQIRRIRTEGVEFTFEEFHPLQQEYAHSVRLLMGSSEQPKPSNAGFQTIH